MTLTEITTRFGWPVLARFAVLVVLFVLLHAARWPLLALLCCLAGLLARIDRAVSTRLAHPVPTTRRRRTA